MASSRKPGPVGLGSVHEAIDDGTLCRQASPTPGSVGVHRNGKPGHQARHHLERHVHVRAPKIRAVHIPKLQIGSRGRDVERLQRLLNSRLYGGPALKADGRFGEKTRAAVLEFQKKSRLVPDAIVGRKTWFQLLSAPVKRIAALPRQKGGTGTGQVTTASTTATSGPAPSAAVVEKGVDEWSLAEKFEYVLQRSGSYMAPDLRDQFAALLTPTNLGIVIGTLVVWAGGHFFGVSEVTDAFLFGFGLVFLGWAAVDAARYLKNFLELTCTASTKDQLEEAASDLAQAIAIIGVVAFFALLAKVARSLGKASKAADEGAAAPKDDAQPAPKSKPQAASTERTAEPEESTPSPEELVAQRRAVAQDFYRSQGMSEKKIAQHMKGIDFTKPVEVTTLKPGTVVSQWQKPGAPQGNYYTPPGTDSGTLGMNPAGKVELQYVVKEPVQVLKSTAGDIEDWEGSGVTFQGGGTQYFTTNSSAFGTN